MKKSVFIPIISVILLTGCSQLNQKDGRDTVLYDETIANWVVVKQSGGVITDVWKLEDTRIHTIQYLNGWAFRDKNNNTVNLRGDIHAINIENNKDSIFATYVEYHMEFDSVPYVQRYKEYLQTRK